MPAATAPARYYSAAKRAGYVLPGEAVESVKTHAVAVEVPRQCRQGREPRQTVVERGVETGDLRQSGPGTTDGGDPREIVRLMQRRQRTELKKLGLQRPCDDGGTVAVRTTVDDAMPDGGQRERRGDAARSSPGAASALARGRQRICARRARPRSLRRRHEGAHSPSRCDRCRPTKGEAGYRHPRRVQTSRSTNRC